MEGHVCLGDLFNGTGKYEKSVEEFQRAVQSDPSNDYALEGLANAYTNMGDFAAAESTYKKAIALRSKYWGGYSQLESFITIRPGIPMLPRCSARPLDWRQTTTEAILIWEQHILFRAATMMGSKRLIVRLVCGRIRKHTNLGYTYFLMHRFPDAVDVLAQAVRFDGSESEVWGNLGDALYWSPDRRAEMLHARIKQRFRWP